MIGESIPPGVKGLCKCTHEEAFTHNVMHDGLGEELSIPPALPKFSDWTNSVPLGLKEEAAVVAQSLYGDWVKGLEPQEFRMCW